MEITIWKVSQSPKFFSDQENEDLFKRKCVCVHPDTRAKGISYTTQGENFSNVKKGDFFYLCYGNECIRLFGMFTGESQGCKLAGKSDWLEQKYELYFESRSNDKYQGHSAWWTPSDNSTFTKCKNNEEFQEWILKPFFQKTLKDIEMMTNNEEYLCLLKNNSNLILTGAPGTGKTYLAKELAKKVISQEVKETPIKILESLLENYNVDESQEQQYKKILEDFLNQFPKEKLQYMSLEDYCIGNSDENENNFCYWMERKLKPLGYYFPGSSRSYLLYWSKSDGKYKVHGYLKQEKDKSEDELMTVLASDIYEMVKDNNPSSMAKKFGDSFILKILSTYYPEEYAPINSKTHIENILSMFNIESKNKSIF
ncbi:MAG: ATP-binding protein [Bacteroidales bacterium]|nr:ATP-binding protein [Bacteroidales bacterium]